ncbi:MAG: hypothetical protein ACK5MW_07000 [Enterococcus sp.]
MDVKLAMNETTLLVEFELNLAHTPQEIWPYLTETPKIQRWFLEISIGKLEPNGFMLFQMPDEQLKMPILALSHEQLLEFTWGFNGSVAFHIKADEFGSQIYFNETLPADFPNVSLDITGWSFALERLQDLNSESSYHKTAEMNSDAFKERLRRYEEILESLKVPAE